MLSYKQLIFLNFPSWGSGKNELANAGDTEDLGDLASIPGSGRFPGRGNGNPLQYSCLGNSMDKGLVGYSLWYNKESDTTYMVKPPTTVTCL